MKIKTTLLILLALITCASLVTTITAITSTTGNGSFHYTTIRGEEVTIYGLGPYRHMTSAVAVQGIAQDYITLFVALPFLWVSFFLHNTSVRGRILLTGTLLYFSVTYVFYTTMAMYNELFLLYILLMGTCVFGFFYSLFDLYPHDLATVFRNRKTLHLTSYFIITNCVLIALLWLSMIVPPLLNGTLYPKEVEHYTTLIVQGFDLGILLPLGIVAGVLQLRNMRWGFLLMPTYLVFLSILMIALTAKIIFMAHVGVNIIPVVFIIPTITAFSIFLLISLLRTVDPTDDTP